MDHNLLGSLTDITQELRQSQALLHRLEVHARAVREGSDESGTITIVVDDQGTARDVQVTTDWRRRLAPPAVGAAVVAADAEAANRRATATLEALASADVAHLSTEESAPPEPGRRLSVPELAAAVFAAFEDLDRITEPPPLVYGTGAQGAVRLSMAQGRITECAVDERWLAHQDDVTLAHGLREAVSAAAAAAVAARAPFVEYQQRLQALVADAHTVLADVHADGPR